MKPLIKLGGYTYYKVGGTEMKQRWRCSIGRTCKGRLHTFEDEIVYANTTHNHPPPTNF